jgi:beta-galactosidase
VRVTDQGGRLSPCAANRVRFSIDGPGEIVATYNGDQTNMEPFQAHARQAFNGQIARGKPGRPGKITVRAGAADLAPAMTTILMQ